MKTKHDGDCHIYSSVIHGLPFDGICTCGFALQVQREGRGDEYKYITSSERDIVEGMCYEIGQKAERLDGVIEGCEQIASQSVTECAKIKSCEDSRWKRFWSDGLIAAKILKIAKGENLNETKPT